MLNLKRLIKPKIALALGGGGVRGYAHIGVIKSLIQNNIPIDMIVGTSMGSIIGASYALDLDISRVEREILVLSDSKYLKSLEFFLSKSPLEEKKLIFQKFVHILKDLYLWNMRGARKWLVRFERIIPLVKDFIKDKNFEDTKIKFACIAVNLSTGHESIFEKGKLLDSVLASSSIPGVFPPMKIGDHFFIDGNSTSPIPVEAAIKLGADFVIAVNVERDIYNDSFNSGIDIVFQSDYIKAAKLNQHILQKADFVIMPRVGNINWANFSEGSYCIRKGQEAANYKIQGLKKAILKKRFKI